MLALTLSQPLTALAKDRPGLQAPAARQAQSEELCFQYGKAVSNAADLRDAGMSLVEQLRFMRQHPALQGVPALQQALEQAVIAVYQDMTLPGVRLRQMAETICLTTLEPTVMRPGPSTPRTTTRY
jgi:hypothetical protein